jgi:hypothetical protein
MFLQNIPFVVNNKLNPWYKHRDMPDGKKESFSEWYEKEKRSRSPKEDKQKKVYIFMNSRERILQGVLKIRSCNAVPDISMFKGDQNATVRQYMEVFKTIGGSVFLVDDLNEVKLRSVNSLYITSRV